MADLNVLQNTLSAIAATLQQLTGGLGGAAPTPSQPTPSSVPVLPTPPITSYTSARSQALPPSSLGHPVSSTSSHLASTHQPILGIAGLGISMSGHTTNARMSNRGSGSGAASASQLTAPQISQANAGRQHAISSHFPPTTALVPRGRRRGPAVHPPTLSRGPPPTLLDTISFIDIATGIRMVRVKFEVHPSSTPAGSDLILCRRLRTSQLSFMADHSLLYDFILPETTSVVELLRRGARAMQDGPGQFKFGMDHGTRASRHLPHETLPLQILTLINKGNPRGNGVSYLSSHHPVSLSMTIGSMTDPAQRSKFGHSTLCVEHASDGAQLIVRAVIRRPGVRFNSIENDAWPRTHTCLSTRYAHLIDEVTEGDFQPDDGDSTETLTSGGEPPSGSEDDENMPEALLASTSVSAPGPRELPSRSALATQPVVRAQSLQEFGIPNRIFATPFVPTLAGPFRAVFDAVNQPKAVYLLASGGVPGPSLDIEGVNFTEMVEAYFQHIGRAADTNDYTLILSPRRNFRKLHPDGTLLSWGSGLEREILYGLFLIFANQPAKYFSLREQGRCTISTTISMAHRFLVSPVRLRELKILGAVLVLMLLHGMTPAPLSPALFQFVFHGCNLDALTSEFLSEWYPELGLLLSSWVAMGPAGDLAPFQAHYSTYHDLQVPSLQTRNQAQHDAHGADMLYTAIFGPQPPSHPEYKALFSGMEMSCRNGFNMLDLFRSFPGGTERLLSEKWASHIVDFASIEDNLSITSPPAADVARLMGSHPFIIDPTEVLRCFLQRTGIACPALFAVARETLHPMVPLSDVDSPAFRPRMLARACTGSPDLELSKNINIVFSPPGCLEYRGDTAQREFNMANGTVAFASCFRTARIPLTYLLGLHRASYPALDEQGQPTEPRTLQDAIDNWLLMQIVGAIGDLSVL
ncbi:hypothetical protein FB451DRAFT_1437063 [Mycena latifolia]|nr:hypothetical protein FB451DRAFT_1437063 [Mycena latifolia]